MDVKSKRKKYREKSIKVLSSSTASRNSDWSFLLEYLKREGVYIPAHVEMSIKNSNVNIHTALRERQKIQAEGLYLPTNPEILKQRRKLNDEYREAYSN